MVNSFAKGDDEVGLGVDVEVLFGVDVDVSLGVDVDVLLGDLWSANLCLQPRGDLDLGLPSMVRWPDCMPTHAKSSHLFQ